jgi:hypothetical protein
MGSQKKEFFLGKGSHHFSSRPQQTWPSDAYLVRARDKDAKKLNEAIERARLTATIDPVVVATRWWSRP